MKLNIFGMGYVGCVSAACLAVQGNDVTGIDVDKTKVDMINHRESPIIEPRLQEMIQRGVDSNKFRATLSDIGQADVSIVCVGTPSDEKGGLDLKYIARVVEQIGDYLRTFDSYHVVNIRSTVLPGTVESILIPLMERRSGKRAGTDFGVCMNPEFMREGTSISDFYSPPFTLIGQLDNKSGDVVEPLYRAINAPLVRSRIKVAEIVKYVCNAFHALKVSFANEIGVICKGLGIDSHEVMDIFCKDTKLNLSAYYLKPGFAFGGSCLPKDLRALLRKTIELDIEAPLLNSILVSNRRQIDFAYKLVTRKQLKKIGVLGLSFKIDSDDLRESPIIELVERLLGKGYHVSIYDREVALARLSGSNKRYIEQTIPHISSLMKDSLKEVLDNSEVIIISKNDKEFQRVGEMNGKFVLDLARVLPTSNLGDGKYEGICW